MLDIFAHHALSVSEISADKVLSPSPWATILICASLFLLTLIIVPFRRKFSLIIKSFFSQRHYSLMNRESRILEERVYIFTLLFDLLVFATGLLVIIQHFMSQSLEKIHPMAVFGILFVGLLIIYWLKYLVYFIYSKLFEHSKELTSINLYKFLFITVAALVLFPFVIIAQYTGHFAVMYGYIPVFVAFYVLFAYKMLKINPRNINLFNFFLYFCTLEILPYVLLVKLSTMI
ncbi:MAG: DUF4271 domain-containing protein [Bacteroidales bacterium]|nr:DUF4271 domain-containing protein [Bacteroidales bacterium]